MQGYQAFSSEAFLRKALDSVECQTYPHIEHILNYSPSSDATLTILADYAARVGGHYPVKLVRFAPRGDGRL